MSEVDETRRRVRQLLLSGDNTLKNRHDPAARERARDRFEEARRLAAQADLPQETLTIIERRLEALDRSRPAT